MNSQQSGEKLYKENEREENKARRGEEREGGRKAGITALWGGIKSSDVRNLSQENKLDLLQPFQVKSKIYFLI